MQLSFPALFLTTQITTTPAAHPAEAHPAYVSNGRPPTMAGSRVRPASQTESAKRRAKSQPPVTLSVLRLTDNDQLESQ